MYIPENKMCPYSVGLLTKCPNAGSKSCMKCPMREQALINLCQRTLEKPVPPNTGSHVKNEQLALAKNDAFYWRGKYYELLERQPPLSPEQKYIDALESLLRDFIYFDTTGIQNVSEAVYARCVNRAKEFLEEHKNG